MVMEDTLLSRAPSSPRIPMSGRHSSVGMSVMSHGNEAIAAANRLGLPSDASNEVVNLIHVASSPNLSSPFGGHSLQQLASIEYPAPRSLSLTNSTSQNVDLNMIRNVHGKESNSPSLVRLRSLPLDEDDNRNVSVASTQQRSLPGTPLSAPKGGMLLLNKGGCEDITLQFQLSIDNSRCEGKILSENENITSIMETEENVKIQSTSEMQQAESSNFESQETFEKGRETMETTSQNDSVPIEIIVKQSSVETSENMDEDTSSLAVDSSCDENPPPLSHKNTPSSVTNVAEARNQCDENKEKPLSCGEGEEEDEEENIEEEVKNIMESQESTTAMRIARRDYRSSQTPPSYQQRYDDIRGDPSTQTFSSLKEKDASPFASVYSSSSSPYTLPHTAARSSSFNTTGLGSQSPYRAGNSSPTSSWQYAIQTARNRHYSPAHHTLPGNYSSLSKKSRSQSTVANPYCPYNTYSPTIGSNPTLSNQSPVSHQARREHLALHNLTSDLSKSKRRSVSTCASALSVSPPCKAGRRSSGTFSEEELSSAGSNTAAVVAGVESNVSSPSLTGILSSSSTPSEKMLIERQTMNDGSPAPSVVKFRVGSDAETRARIKSGSHVRFSDDFTGMAALPPSGAIPRSRVQSPTGTDSASNASTPMSSTLTPGTRCHHLIAEEGENASSSAFGISEHPHGVVRTRSNPEMECCPLCLARKECEILVKRTYSTKV